MRKSEMIFITFKEHLNFFTTPARAQIKLIRNDLFLLCDLIAVIFSTFSGLERTLP